jgi:hypothetical protein
MSLCPFCVPPFAEDSGFWEGPKMYVCSSGNPGKDETDREANQLEKFGWLLLLGTDLEFRRSTHSRYSNDCTGKEEADKEYIYFGGVAGSENNKPLGANNTWLIYRRVCLSGQLKEAHYVEQRDFLLARLTRQKVSEIWQLAPPLAGLVQ